MKDVRVIEVKKSVFESNDERAALLRKDLKDKGAFAEGFEGMDYNTQMNQFLTGEVAMISHSSPIIPEMFNSESEILDDISFFAFPYFEDKPEYKDTCSIYFRMDAFRNYE